MFDDVQIMIDLRKQVQHVVASFNSAAPVRTSTAQGALLQQQGSCLHNGHSTCSGRDNADPFIAWDLPNVPHSKQSQPAVAGMLQGSCKSRTAVNPQQSCQGQLHQASKENSTPHHADLPSLSAVAAILPVTIKPAASCLPPFMQLGSQSMRKPLQALSTNCHVQQLEQEKTLCKHSTTELQDIFAMKECCMPSRALHPAQQSSPATLDSSPNLASIIISTCRSELQPNGSNNERSSISAHPTCSSTAIQAAPAAAPAAATSEAPLVSGAVAGDSMEHAIVAAATQHAANLPSRSAVSLAKHSSTNMFQPLAGSKQSSSTTRIKTGDEPTAAGLLAAQRSDPSTDVDAKSDHITSQICSSSRSDHRQEQLLADDSAGLQRKPLPGATENTAQGSAELSSVVSSSSAHDFGPAPAQTTATPPVAAPYTSCVVHTPAPYAKHGSSPTGHATVAPAVAGEQRRRTADTVVSAARATQAFISLITGHHQAKLTEIASHAVPAEVLPVAACVPGAEARPGGCCAQHMQAPKVPGRAQPLAAAATVGLSQPSIDISACNSNRCTGIGSSARVYTADSQQYQAWQQKQQGILAGRQGAASALKSILDPFTSSSSNITISRRKQQQTTAEGVCQSRRTVATAATERRNSFDSSNKRALATVASLAESAFARVMQASTLAEEPAGWKDNEHQCNATDFAGLNLAATSMLVAVPEAGKGARKLPRSIIPPFLQPHVAALQSARHVAVQAHLDPAAAAAQLQYPAKLSVAENAGKMAVMHDSCGDSASMTEDTVVPWGRVASVSSSGRRLLQQTHGVESEQQLWLAASTGAGQLKEQNLLARRRLSELTDSSSASNVPQYSLGSEETATHAEDASGRPLTRAVRRYLEQQQLQHGLEQQHTAEQQQSDSSSGRGRSSIAVLGPAHAAAAAAAARVLQRLAAYEGREAAAAGFLANNAMAAAGSTGMEQQATAAAKITVPVAAVSCESHAPKHHHMQSLFGKASLDGSAATKSAATGTAGELALSSQGAAAVAAPGHTAILQELQVTPHLLLQLHLQLKKLRDDHAGAGQGSSTSTGSSVSHTSRPLSAAAASSGSSSVVKSATGNRDMSASSVADSLADTAQSTLSYKLPQHLLVRSPYVGLYSGDLDYVATAVRYHHGMANCRDVFYIRHERAVSEHQVRPGARRVLTWGEKQAASSD